MDANYRQKITDIANNSALPDHQRRHEAGKLTRETALRFKEEGKTVSEISELLGLEESTVRTLVPQFAQESTTLHGPPNIWYPGPDYHGRTDEHYGKTVAELPEMAIIQIVGTRAKEDGDWAIDKELVGDDEDKMRRMMAFVSDETNILQALSHIYKENMQTERTVDWLCRELANASKVMIR